jgi:protein SCO1/2
VSEASTPELTGEATRAADSGSQSLLKSPFFWAAIAGLIFIPLMRPLLRREPAPPPVLTQLPSFALTDSEGRAFGKDDLAGQVWVANFFFTRCPSICPLLTRAMAKLEQRYTDEGVDVRLLGITVDPEYDTPEVLRQFGEEHGIDPERWLLVGGDLEAVRTLVVDGFLVGMGLPETQKSGLVDISHYGKFAIIDGDGGVRGYYETDELGLDEIFHRSQHVLKEQRARE